MIKVIGLAVVIALSFPVYIGAENTTVGNVIVGSTCLVPIYHTDFAFPPEGGAIIRIGNGQMYFVRTYIPGCENAGSIGTPISSSAVNVVNKRPPVTPVVTNPNPPFTAPATGCNN